jgi:hypothetical protein
MIAGETFKCYNIPIGEEDESDDTKSNTKSVTSISNTWTKCASSVYHLRIGPNYSKNGNKAPSNEALYNIVGIDVIKTPKKIDNITNVK